MSTPPTLAVIVERSLEFDVVIDHIEADISNRFNHHSRIALDAANGLSRIICLASSILSSS